MLTYILSAIIVLSCQVSASTANQFVQAKELDKARAAVLGWTPMPTAPAQLPHNWLEKRDAATSLCGYVSGSTDYKLTCDTSNFCGFNTESSYFGCCDQAVTSAGSTYLTGCEFFTACNDYTMGCDASCSSKTDVAVCTDTDEPYCVTYSLFDGLYSYSNFGCSPTSADVVMAYSNLTVTDSSSDTMSFTSSVAEPQSSQALSATSALQTSFGTDSSLSSSSSTSSSSTSSSSMGDLIPGGIGSTGSLVPFTQSQTSNSGGLATVTVTTSGTWRVQLSLGFGCWMALFVVCWI